jgi:predicted membrane channel-forming protein YqfA (hemolysin III family)
VNDSVRKAIFPLYLIAGLAMVLLAAVWAQGWFTSPLDLYEGHDNPGILILVTALVLAAWNLISCVIAAGFYHAASKHPATHFRQYRNASIRLMLMGTIFLFPVPLMTYVLGGEPYGRALALLITGISLAGVVFGRARIKAIGKRLGTMLEAEKHDSSLAPLPT